MSHPADDFVAQLIETPRRRAQALGQDAGAMNSSSFREAWALLPDYLSQHVMLSVSALILGVAISVPLGIVAARSEGLRRAGPGAW